jgi:two-component system, chemotaxis family, chemotaxis protein CheY
LVQIEREEFMKVLIVDDSRAMRMIVKRTLRQVGYGAATVNEASNGKEALESIQAERPDLVLSDWNMPEMSGIELLQEIKARSMPVRVGLVTSQGTPEMQQRAKDAGALFLLTKPFTPEAFKAALEPVLG